MECDRITRALPALALVLTSVAPLASWAADGARQVERYSTIAPVASVAQTDPLEVVVTIVFPNQIATVDEALRYVLRRSGYRLASTEAADPANSVLAKQPLPEVHRQLGPITVARALSTLTGPAWSTVVDPVHRLVSFDLAQDYAAIDLPRDATASPSRDMPSAPVSGAPECDARETWTWC